MTTPRWCCAQMAAQLTYVCPDHPAPQDCPDVLVRYDAETDSYGLWIHDGGSSFITSAYCPWCGAHLAPHDAWAHHQLAVEGAPPAGEDA